jgi:hypothetical protein
VQLDQLGSWAESCYYWPDVLSELRRVLIRTEQISQQKLKVPDTGVWIETLHTGAPKTVGTEGVPPANTGAVPPVDAAAATPGDTNEVSALTIRCRAVNMGSVLADANTTIIYALENELKASTNYFDPEKTQLVGTIVPDDATGTFTFEVLVALKHPLKP